MKANGHGDDYEHGPASPAHLGRTAADGADPAGELAACDGDREERHCGPGGECGREDDRRSSRAAAEALADEIGLDRARAMRADVTDPGEVGAMFASARAAFGRPVTTVVNNAVASFSFNGDAVNMVSGGLLRTTDASAATPDAVFDLIAASTPLRRVTTPEEFADAVLFFASPWARSVTGQNLVVDGGLVKD
jgi:NAD(P)-dependent dehydrogenase (short-subunit alcohol dehydrogenase family)